MIRILLVLILISLLCACKEEPVLATYLSIGGETMGTTYAITYKGYNAPEVQKDIDSMLLDFDFSLSTYNKKSKISAFNQSDESIRLPIKEQEHFLRMLNESAQLYKMTDGAFDPSIYPLYQFYGFGGGDLTRSLVPDVSQVDSIMDFIGYDKISWTIDQDSFTVVKEDARSQLDFSSIAKGYGVDLVADYLGTEGVDNYFVEIGGEIRTKGVNAQGKIWTAGLTVPDPNAGKKDMLLPIKLRDMAVASSGNYRNYYDIGGMRFVHIIDPTTGKNKASDVLSASILSRDCFIADALATACIVKGYEGCKNMIEKIEGIEACIVYAESDSMKIYYTPSYEKLEYD